MEKIRTFHAVTIGQSHIKKDMPCQDAAISFEDHENQVYIGVVSDGHGSKDYFRSEVGSNILVNETTGALKSFAEQLKEPLFQEKYFSRGTLTEINQIGSNERNADVSPSNKKNEEVLNHLFKSIIAKWQEAIMNHWKENNPTDDFLIKKGVSEKRRLNFLNNQEIEIAYGCTLLAFLKTKEYWISFQLGDGMCIAFDEEMNDFAPIPKDPQCEGSTTTSMCQSNAFDNFRFAYGTKNIISLFVGSDGMEGRYGDLDFYTIPQITKDYELITKTFFNNEYDKAYEMIKEALPAWSLKDSNQKDDLSFAGWVDLSDNQGGIKKITFKEKKEAEQKLIEAEAKLEKEQEELNGYKDSLVDKRNDLLSLDEKLNTLMLSYEESKSEVQILQNNLQLEEEKQLNLKSERDTTLAQKQKLEAELNNITKVKENKSLSIQNMLEEKEKTKSLIEEITDRISKFFGGN